MASAQALEWQASMERDLASLSKHDVYELVSAPKGRKIIWIIVSHVKTTDQLADIFTKFLDYPNFKAVLDKITNFAS